MSGTRPSLPHFQEEAAQNAVRQLRRPKGSGRFLVADEVGLGKTHIAKRVSELLCSRRLVYVCSSQAIVEQNRSKLALDASVHRATDLLRRARRPARIALTPGTSMRGGTGTARERVLLLELAWAILAGRKRKRRSRPPKAWSRFFQLGVSDASWSWYLAERGRAGRPSATVERLLQKAWTDTVAEDSTLTAGLGHEVTAYAKGRKCRDGRRRHTLVISKLRQAAQRAAIGWLAPDLVVLDEVQRFRAVLGHDAETGETRKLKPAEHRERESFALLGKILFRRGARVLLLSATPWKAVSLQGDPTRHRRELRQTLAFLHGCPKEAEKTFARVEPFAQRIAQGRGEYLKAIDEELRSSKDALQSRLAEVMSRTERSWFMLGSGSAPGDSVRRALPDERQLRDFLDLGTFLRDKAGAGASATEWWKSCPQPLTFLDASYTTFQKVREHPVPAGLVARRDEITGLVDRNPRMRELRDLFRGAETSSWRHLWIPPRLRYYRSPATDSPEPTKVLVFTGWRFVPRAIAGILSADVEQDLGIAPGALARSHGLAVSGKRLGAGPVLDVCYPSLFLADAVNPLDGAHADRDPASLVEAARVALEEALRSKEIKVVERGGLPRWQVLARIEGYVPGAVNQALRKHRRPGLGRGSSWLLRKVRRWAGPPPNQLTLPNDLKISRKELDRLAEAAVFSPAVSAVRALRRVRGEITEDDRALLTWLGLEVLRNYFGKTIVQRVVEGAVPPERGRGYPDRVLRYCRDRHIQAVLDEYLHLASDADRDRHPLLALGDVLSIGKAFTTINVRKADGRLAQRPQQIRAHVALAFGEDVRDDRTPGRPNPGDGPSHQSDVAGAFNSPFWPFVLATTAVGQEGLDFHLYCRDIVHWNLPTSPVDFEQREGRINRRQGFAIRDQLARDWLARGMPLDDGRLASGAKNPWKAIFDAYAAEEDHHFTFGLHPHWLLAGSRAAPPLRRHVFAFEGSRDDARLAQLRSRLLSYRFVFGQPDQELLMEDLEEQAKQIGPDAIGRMLPLYVVNLSPISEPFRRRLARERAAALAGDPARLRALLDRVCRMQAEENGLAKVRGEIDRLVEVVSRHLLEPASLSSRQLREAIASLWYLVNPFDLKPDHHEVVGLQDDAQRVAEAVRAIVG